MKNFKINTNRPPLSDADIAKGKDFSQVVKAYKAAKIPFYKLPKIWLGSSVLVAAGIAIFIVVSKLSATEMPSAFINPPLAVADIKSTTYVLNAQADSTIVYPSGSKIHVPANAFRDKKGNVIKGNVELHYREFKKPIDVFMAGIPMTYDSAGQRFTFETAGMMEISASQNGEGLNTNPDALVKVDMLSDNKDDRFNTYYLDTAERKWKYQEQVNYNRPQNSDLPQSDSLSLLANTSGDPALSKEAQAVAQVEKAVENFEQQKKPVKPIKEQKNKPRFTIKVDPSEFPEIAVYRNVKFQVEDKNYKEDKANITWSDIELKRIPGSRNYSITFINPNESYTVIAAPVFNEKDYESANSVYAEKYKEFEAALAQKKTDAEKRKADLEAREQAARAAMQRQAEQANIPASSYAQRDLIYRSFTVSNFGFWNSDHPCTYPVENSSVKLVLIDAATKKPVEAYECYQIEKGRNILFNYLEDGMQKFSYNPGKQYGLWVIGENQNIAVAKYSAFKTARRKGDKLEVEVTMLDKSLKTTEEIRNYLEL